ncbi:hypothetical protein BOX15_Mlig004323g2 [Macrostomum lignano]|uniref:Uncharacterized protein n=1 Tax=Macrostomum lignano TaxID=282301 RepID=A0A267E847_9PLAT|nr:hypothetical protein BOX15_Mlig004323g2 [Macrostomum lignano]
MPRGRKRPSAAGDASLVEAQNGSTKRAARDVDGASGRIRARTLPFPLPIAVTNLPTIDSAAVVALEAAYGGVRFPQELLKLFEFCLAECDINVDCSANKLNGGTGAHKNAADRFKSTLRPLGIEPCGPFDFLLCYGAASSSNDKATVLEYDWLTHCRYAHDPPEFLTLFVAIDDANEGDQKEFHIGYVRDSPELEPACLASNSARVDGHFDLMGESILYCLALHAQRRCKKSLSAQAIQQQNQLISKLAKFCHQPVPSAAEMSKVVKCRSRAKKTSGSYTVVAPTLNGLGLCVRLSSDGVGYRELPETDASLRKLLTQIAAKCDSESDKQTRLTLLEPVDELVTLVQFANDEGDPGMGLELGLDLLSVPTKIGCYDDLIEGLLATGYGLVGRSLYADIVRRHMKVRLDYRVSVPG